MWILVEVEQSLPLDAHRMIRLFEVYHASWDDYFAVAYDLVVQLADAVAFSSRVVNVLNLQAIVAPHNVVAHLASYVLTVNSLELGLLLREAQKFGGDGLQVLH